MKERIDKLTDTIYVFINVLYEEFVEGYMGGIANDREKLEYFLTFSEMLKNTTDTLIQLQEICKKADYLDKLKFK